MKILLCTNTFSHIHHGPAKFANLILEINQIFPEHEIRILTEDIKESSNYIYKMEVKIPKVFIPFGQVIRMFLYDKNVKHIKKEYDFDVVIYINSYFGLINARQSRSYLSVGMINDDNNVDINLGNFSFSRLWAKRFFFKMLERSSVKKHDLIISNSNYLSQKLISEYNIKPERIKRLYKSVDLSKSVLNLSRTFNDPIKILFVKADFFRGGIQTLAESLKRIKEKNFEIVIIGPSEKLKTTIENFFKENKNCKVIFLGEQPQIVVFEQFQKCDIFCVPSYKEALGVANIEALAFGIPVVTTETGGIPEVMDQGNIGWLSIPRDAGSLEHSLRACIDSPQERLLKAQKGYEFVRIKFDKMEMFKNLLSILKETQRA